MAQIQKTTVISSTDADYLYDKGMELFHDGEFERSLTLLIRALELRPRFATAWYQKGVCLDHMDRCEEAINSYDMSIMNDPGHAEAWFNKGMLLKKMGRHDEGNRSVQKAVDLCCGR